MMLSEGGIDSRLAALEVPLSPEEEEKFVYAKDGHVNEMLDRIRYHNCSLIRRLDAWQQYIAGKGPKPSEELLRFLIPGRNDENPERLFFKDVTDFFADFAHGSTPCPNALYDATKSCFLLFRNLAKFNVTDHLRSAKDHFRQFIQLIGYKGEPKMLRDEFASRITESCDGFLSERSANAIEIGAMLSSPEKARLPANDDNLSLAEHQSEVRRRAVSLINGYCREMACSKKKAIEAVQKVVWKEFKEYGLKFGTNNLKQILYDARFSGSPPADADALRRASLI